MIFAWLFPNSTILLLFECKQSWCTLTPTGTICLLKMQTYRILRYRGCGNTILKPEWKKYFCYFKNRCKNWWSRMRKQFELVVVVIRKEEKNVIVLAKKKKIVFWSSPKSKNNNVKRNSLLNESSTKRSIFQYCCFSYVKINNTSRNTTNHHSKIKKQQQCKRLKN